MNPHFKKEDLEKVLRHHIESHGLRFHAVMCGKLVSNYHLKNTTEFIGIRVDESSLAFGVVTEKGIPLQFAVTQKSHIDAVAHWLQKALANLSSETCQDYAMIPTEVIFVGGVAECRETLKRYTEKKEPALI